MIIQIYLYSLFFIFIFCQVAGRRYFTLFAFTR
nr:MAG TPA: hypothetical protein [Caudoviricetes sp.]DAU96719.1 MAG TPA: hypothetical protein [Caudoviricetes sp.]